MYAASENGHVSGSSVPTTRTAEVHARIRSSLAYWELKHKVREEILKGTSPADTIRKELPELVQGLGFEPELQRLIESTAATIIPAQSPLQSKQNASTSTSTSSPSPSIRAQAQTLWESRLAASLQVVAREQLSPFIRQRRSHSRPHPRERFDDGSEWAPVRPAWTPSDLLELLSRCHEGNAALISPWRMVAVPVAVPTTAALRECMYALRPACRQWGWDEQSRPSWADESCKVGRRAIVTGTVAAAREYSLYGLPPSLRCSLWMQMLGVVVDARGLLEFEQLQGALDSWELLSDDLVLLDTLAIGNDPSYFIFEAFVTTVALCLSRDPRLRSLCSAAVTPPLVSSRSGSLSAPFPPSGFVPGEGWALLVAPLSYVCRTEAEAFHLHRALFARYWCKLQVVNCEGGILSLCVLAEDLFRRAAPSACYHLIQLGIQPLSLIFPWLSNAFTSYLEPAQCLQLWDRVVAFDRLDILAVAAAAILDFRKTALESCEDREQVDALITDMSTVSIVPLLQDFLFSQPDEIGGSL